MVSKDINHCGIVALTGLVECFQNGGGASSRMQEGTTETVAVTGTGLVEGCKVFLDDKEHKTKYINATRMTAEVAGSIVANTLKWGRIDFIVS